jgi:hypothetical protein
MTYLWPNGLPVEMEADALGTPQCLVWRGQHPVAQVARRWRVDEEWWQQRIWREYFKLATTSNPVVVVYRDFIRGGWYLQQLYD